jgi:hypothetical protein
MHVLARTASPRLASPAGTGIVAAGAVGHHITPDAMLCLSRALVAMRYYSEELYNELAAATAAMIGYYTCVCRVRLRRAMGQSSKILLWSPCRTCFVRWYQLRPSLGRQWLFTDV